MVLHVSKTQFSFMNIEKWEKLPIFNFKKGDNFKIIHCIRTIEEKHNKNFFKGKKFPKLKYVTFSNGLLSNINSSLLPLSLINADFHGNNRIKKIPRNLNLPNLTIFDLKSNKIKKIPRNLNLPKLCFFSLSVNKIKKIPKNLNLPNLTNFGLNHNKFKKIPKNLNFPEIRNISLSFNRIKKLY